MAYIDTLTLLDAIDRAYKPTTFFRDTFFPKEETFASSKVLVDYRKGSRKMAPFVSRKGGHINVGRNGFSTREYEPPMMAPSRVTTFQDIMNRGFGEHVESRKTPEERAIELLAKDVSELIDMNTRRIEWMCAQTMLYAGFTAKGTTDDGAVELEDTVSFGEFTQKKTLSGEDTWDKPTADIYGCMTDMYWTIAKNSGRTADVLITTSKTLGYMLKNDDILKYLLRPKEQLNIATIAPKITMDMVTNFGVIPGLNNLQIYGYDGVYEDDTGTLQAYIPDGYVIMGRTGTGSQVFGAITQVEEMDGKFHTYEGAYVPKIWTDVGGDSQQIRMASKCIPKPDCIDDWFTLKAY